MTDGPMRGGPEDRRTERAHRAEFGVPFAVPVLRSSGPPVLRSSGPPVLRSSGPPDLRTSGPPVLRSSGPPVLRSSGPSQLRSRRRLHAHLLGGERPFVGQFGDALVGGAL